MGTKCGSRVRCVLLVLCALLCSAAGTPNVVELYIDAWALNVTDNGFQCLVSALQGQLYADWQAVLQSSPMPPVGSLGAILYATLNADAPGNLALGLSAPDLTWLGFLHTAAGFSLGTAVNGTVQQATVPARRITGSGGGPANATVTLLSVDARGVQDGGASLLNIAPLQSAVYGSPFPSTGLCLVPAQCQNAADRWEVRIVIMPNQTGVWAWAEGYQQFYTVYPVDLRFVPLTLEVFSQNRGSPAAPLYPRLSGIDMRVKLEQNFSRVASRIYNSIDMRSTLAAAPGPSTLFSTVPGTQYNVPPANTQVPCPSIDFIYTGPVAPPADSYTPLLVWNLSVMNISLSRTQSYTIEVNYFVKNLTSASNSLFVSLYDGTTALGVVTQPSSTGLWGSLVSSPTGINGNPGNNFPVGAPFVAPVTNNPNATLITAFPYSSKRILLSVFPFVMAGQNASVGQQFTVYASDPESPLAQIPAGGSLPALRKKRLEGRIGERAASLALYPYTPFVNAGPLSVFKPFDISTNSLQVVLWQRQVAGQPPLDSGVTGASLVIDEAVVGCDGKDHGGFNGPVPAFDACGVCGGDNSTCQPCANSTVRDACGVCGGNNSTCCINYNGVSNACWDWLLLQATVSDVVNYLQALRAAVASQCSLAQQGTEGFAFCCSPSLWPNSTTPAAAIQNQACQNRDWNAMCLQTFTQTVQTWTAALQAAANAKKKK